MSYTIKLFRLQQIDTQLDHARVRLREIETLLSDDTHLQQAQSEVNHTQEALQAAHSALHQAEQIVQDQHIKIEQTEATLYGGKVHNPKELQDLQNEAAALKRYLAVLEDRQLEAMLATEEAETQAQAAQANHQSVLAQVTEQQAGLRGEQATLVKTVERYEVERQAALGAIPPADRDLYEQLRQQRRGVAVAQVSSKCCNACGATLTPALIQSACSASQLVRCPSCNRILYAG
jgi:hypothetical protein